ncbi:hypothetical protein [Microbacterium sp. NC79]|uniref:hypothetical protein n=1 Tax=Microbacterium sp. NC79 TaxID=2851009 RepID=UPI001C2CA228|nr:hypothetical protein [Microbacterium sp. NC79]MBV0894262.1 hypothetical protein [Microbacterium sp. NC79]
MPKPQSTITITDADMRSHGRDVMRYLMTTPTMLIAFAFVALASVAAIVVSLMTNNVTMLIAGLGMIVITALVPFLLRSQAKKMLRAAAPEGSRLATSITDDTVWLQSPLATQTLKLSGFQKATLVGDTLILRFRGSTNYLALPVRAFTPDAVATARERVGA